jgi:hypothetical protein
VPEHQRQYPPSDGQLRLQAQAMRSVKNGTSQVPHHTARVKTEQKED